jgi:hypothetical protein
MDLYTGAVGSNLDQVHDFNPGIRLPSRLFWIQPVSDDSLEVDLEDGTATLSVNNLTEGDFTTLANSLSGGSGVPGSVSFKLTWTATGDPFNVTDSVHGFTGRFQISNASIEWSAKAPNFTFVSDRASSINKRSVLGRERNGIFFGE